MATAIPWLSRDEFWSVIEECRKKSHDVASFADWLVSFLTPWDFQRLGGFYNTMWYDIRVFHRGQLWDVMLGVDELLGTQNAWECYGGWLIVQGRAFHEAVMSDPSLALSCLPTWDELEHGESIIFAAQAACLRKTNQREDLFDVLGDFLPPDAFTR
jgi:hypothetical protein